MFIADCDFDETKKEALKFIKTCNSKHRLKKIDFKKVDRKGKNNGGLFNVRIEKLSLEDVNLQQSEQLISVPSFIVDTCNFLRSKIETDGLFRKPGVVNRQKKLRHVLTGGGSFRTAGELCATDVADLLKQFFRELPEPCIPYQFHEHLISCLDCNGMAQDCVFVSLLLLPLEYLNTLAYLMQFLNEVAEHRLLNRMDVTNLAIVWTPNLLPPGPDLPPSRHHLDKRLILVKLLIERAGLIGTVPDRLREQMSLLHPLSNSAASVKKKKRRSGSLTRMISGIKKMVRGAGPDDCTTPDQPAAAVCTPRIMSTGAKRKASDSMQPSFSAKKRRELLGGLPQQTLLPDICPSHLTPRVLLPQTSVDHCLMDEPQTKNKSRFYTKVTPDWDERRKSTRSLSTSRLRLSHFGIGRKHKKKQMESDDSGLELTATPDTLDVTCSSPDYVRISRREYEDIKSRMSRIESRISSEFENIVGVSISDLEMSPEDTSTNGVRSVQSAYKNTLESAEKFTSPASDELAKRFSRELKIRGSSEKRVIRSPSARKIGSLRRRSKENIPQIKRHASLNVPDRPCAPNQFYPVAKLHRGNPNTISNGLPEPLLVQADKLNRRLNDLANHVPRAPQRESVGLAFDMSDFDFTSFGVLTRSQARRASSFHGCDLSKATTLVPPSPLTRNTNRSSNDTAEWKDAEIFLREEKEEEKPVASRPSLAKLRSQNAGMVLAKTKLFNTMVDSDPIPVKAFKTNRPASCSSREGKKRNSSKLSRDVKLQKKDSEKQKSRISRKDTLDRNRTPSKNLADNKVVHDVARRGTSQPSQGKDTLAHRPQSSHTSFPKSPSQSVKTAHQSRLKENKPPNLSVLPLRERTRFNSPCMKSNISQKSPKVSSLKSNETRMTPNRTVHTPRRSPRQLLLKSKQQTRHL